MLPHLVYLPVNTGVASGFDVNSERWFTDNPEDAFGFGRYPGRYGMALFSKFPIMLQPCARSSASCGEDMPGHLMPDGRDGRPAHYSEVVANAFRLSSKSHWDVPVTIDGQARVHVLAVIRRRPSRWPRRLNGRRMFDEIRFWADYITGGLTASYIVDDSGRRGALAAGAPFLRHGGSQRGSRWSGERLYRRSAVSQVLEHPRVQDPKPVSEGEWTGDRPKPYPGNSRSRTSNFGRIDYVLPVAICRWRVRACGIHRRTIHAARS